MSDNIFIYPVEVIGINDKKFNKFFKVGNLYKIKYIIPNSRYYIFSDKKEWIPINECDDSYDSIIYCNNPKPFIVKKQFHENAKVGSKVRVLVGVDNKSFFWDEKIFEIKKYLGRVY